MKLKEYDGPKTERPLITPLTTGEELMERAFANWFLKKVFRYTASLREKTQCLIAKDDPLNQEWNQMIEMAAAMEIDLGEWGKPKDLSPQIDKENATSQSSIENK